MKVSVFVLSSLSAVASAEFNLRSAFTGLMKSAEKQTHAARIIVGGIPAGSSDLTREEAELISSSAMAAYNEFFRLDSAGQRIGDISIRGFSKVDAEKTWWATQDDAALVSAEVNVLYYKDILKGNARDDLHRTVEQVLCGHLRNSGVAKFGNAKDCVFSFIEQSGFLANKGPVVETAYGSSGAAEAQLVLVGLKGEMSADDTKFLNDVVAKAHKKAFANTELTMDRFATLSAVKVGNAQDWLNQCPFCCQVPDDDLFPCPAVIDDATLVAAKVNVKGYSNWLGQCPFCCQVPDDDLFPCPEYTANASVSKAETKQAKVQHAMQAKISHADFENLITYQLRKSGREVFENVHDVQFNFVFSASGTVIVGSD